MKKGPVIRVSGIRIYAKHGVFDYEKVRDQLFVVDMKVRLRAAPQNDELENTIDYAQLVEIARHQLQAAPKNLIETLAQAILQEVLSLPLVARAKITVHKPQVDLGAPISDVSVTVSGAS